MAEMVPFKGVRYNPELIADMSDVVAPPYDVISPQQQDGFYQRHPHNVIRLILGKAEADDDSQHNIHTRASIFFHQWLAEKILVQDAAQAFYLAAIEFEFNGQQITRYGIIGLVRLEPFDKGIVLPHERTFSKVKSERLKLMKRCHANFSPIFGLYSDNNGIVSRLDKYARDNTPEMNLIDDDYHRHKIWCITDPDIFKEITETLEPKQIFIADGHHRYETALNYRDWVAANDPNFSHTHPANFVMMSLTSMEDEGLVILPAHRLLKDVSAENVAAMLDKASEFFHIHSFPLEQPHAQAVARAQDALRSHADGNAVCVYGKGQSALQVLVLKEGVMDRRFAQELPEPLRDLDVTVLTRLLMMDLLGFDQERLDDETRIGYRTNAEEAVRAVLDGEADLTLILNPTKIEQVQRVAAQGLIMPRKSTYFYPKVISGQTFNLLK